MKTQANNLKQRKKSNENAVSPVIGVLLMVTITVVLAGVIAAFVFGMSGTIGNQKIVAATAHQTEGNSIYVTYQGGQDSGKLVNLSVTIDSVEQEPIGEVDGILKVGSSAKYTGDYEGSNRVLVVGTFTDGSSQIVLDTWV
jgi:flagellin-like protein